MDEIKKGLSIIGLTDLEAEVYIKLLELKQTKVSTLAKAIKITRTQLYPLLEKLVEKGIVEKTEGWPRLYRAVETGKLIKMIDKWKKKQIKILTELEHGLKGKTPKLKIPHTIERDQIIKFIENLSWGNHIILFYKNLTTKHKILFNFLNSGLQQGIPGIYIGGEETPAQIRKSMEKFGIDVDSHEKNNMLKIVNYDSFYMTNKKFIPSEITKKWKEFNKEMKKHKHCYGTGEMACFFRHEQTKSLKKYEELLGKTLKFPAIAICAYNVKNLDFVGSGKLILDLIKAHGLVIFSTTEIDAIRSVIFK